MRYKEKRQTEGAMSADVRNFSNFIGTNSNTNTSKGTGNPMHTDIDVGMNEAGFNHNHNKNMNVNHNNNNNKTKNGAIVAPDINKMQEENRISRPTYDDDLIRSSTYSIRSNHTDISSPLKKKSLLNPFLLQMYIKNDYASTLAVNVIPRAVLLQAFHILAPLAIFAQCTANSPLFLLSKKLQNNCHPLYYTRHECIQIAQEEENCIVQHTDHYMNENDSNTNTNTNTSSSMKIRKWVIFLKSFQIFVGRARLIGFFFGFVEFVSVILLFLSHEEWRTRILGVALAVEAPRAMISSLQVFITLGIWLNITDDDLSLLPCFYFLASNNNSSNNSNNNSNNSTNNSTNENNNNNSNINNANNENSNSEIDQNTYQEEENDGL